MMIRLNVAILSGFAFLFAAAPRVSFAESKPLQMDPFFVSPDGKTFLLNGPGPLAAFTSNHIQFGMEQPVDLEFLGANPAARIEPGDASSGHANFLIGADSSQWKRNVPVYSSIRYHNLWPGIDVIYRVQDSHLKADFLVSAEASPAQIKWRYANGAQSAIDLLGHLKVNLGSAQLEENAPEVFQGKARIPGSFQKTAFGEISFGVGSYDHSQALLIDPVIAFGTYFGGGGTSSATSLVNGAWGNIVIAGWTSPVTGSFPRFGAGGGVDAFVASLSPSGAMQFCTYIGGTGDDRINGVTLDYGNNIIVTGSTTSRNFPVRLALQPTNAGGRDGFMMKLNPYGYDFYISTYLGGNDSDQGNGVTTDQYGNIYITGDTRSVNFPVSRPLQPTKSGGQDAFVTKLTPLGQIIYSTFLGGGADEHSAAIGVNTAGEAYLTGSTFSHNFPTSHAYQPLSGGGEDAFVAKLNAAGNTLAFSTYFGGTGGSLGADERANAAAVDPAGNLYIAGQSSSANFPLTTGAYQTTSNGGVDAFAAKFSTTGTLVYSTLLSGSSVDVANAIAVNGAGKAIVGGYTASADFPVTRPFQKTNHGTYNAFLTSLSPTGQKLTFSSYVGGEALDQINAVALDPLGSVLVAGSTSSTDFPTVNPSQQWLNGTQNAFIAKVAMGWKAGVFLNGIWTFDQDRSGAGNQTFTFGQTGDIPVVGDWTGTGQQRIGVFRNGQWLLDANGNGVWDGPNGGDKLVSWGQAGDIPVVGDWTGSGKQSLGLYRGYTWYLDLSGHLSGVATGVADPVYYFGCLSCIPVVGDWAGTGKTKIGTIDRGVWWTEDYGNDYWSEGDVAFAYGGAQDQPVVGDWDGSGVDRPGVFRNGTWILDYNGNRTLEGTAQGDLSFAFGPSTASAVVIR
jgi:hypothetical protein